MAFIDIYFFLFIILFIILFYWNINREKKKNEDQF